MPELQRFVWEWPSLLEQFRGLNPSVGDRLIRACRPIGAERRPDGRLLLIIGCWVPADRTWLAEKDTIQILERGLKQILEEKIDVLVTGWPAGDGLPDTAPDPLVGLSDELRSIGLGCGGSINRAFFAAAARRGMVFECQFPILNYRLDFALPIQRVGVEIDGWNWRAWARPGAADRREREQTLGYEGWSILWFSGDEILHHLNRTIEDVARVVAGRRRRYSEGPE